MKERISTELAEHARIIKEITSTSTQIEDIEEVSKLVIDCYKNGGKVVLFGNGGSAADAQHIAGELVGKLQLQRESLPAISLTTNTSIMSALGNDYGFDRIFERQVESIVESKDIVIGISTSGDSENVIKGILKAKEKGAKTVAFTGRGGGKLLQIADVLLKVPSSNTQRIQEAHILIGHIICGLVEEELFKNKD